MVLTQNELIAALKNEVRILVHLTSKLDATSLDYRPTPKQRSALDLLKYLTIMGPGLLQAARRNGFDAAAWTELEQMAAARGTDETLTAVADLAGIYETELASWSDDDFRAEIQMFGPPMSRGSFIVNMVLGGHAAYRTQLFLYLKSCGREELGTMNLWGGMDPAPAVKA